MFLGVPSRGAPFQVSLMKLLHRERRSVSRAFFYLPPKSLVNEPPSPPGSAAEPLWREAPVYRTVLYISSGVPSRGTLPAGSPLRDHRERHFFSRALFDLILRTPFRPLWFSYDVNQQTHAFR